MELKNFKNYLAFIASVIFFIIIIGYCAIIYANFNNPLEKSEEILIEVNLPVIDWGKYTNLSKQYKDDTILR